LSKSEAVPSFEREIEGKAEEDVADCTACLFRTYWLKMEGKPGWKEDREGKELEKVAPPNQGSDEDSEGVV
jgi:hypothetical protein